MRRLPLLLLPALLAAGPAAAGQPPDQDAGRPSGGSGLGIGMRATEMRRDSTNIAQDDNLAWAFDTFYDRRNGMLFEVNAAGGRMDGQMSNEGRTNFDWNPIWRVEVARFDGGWTMETAMPFKSLRYRPGPAQLWGFYLRRRVRWKNELAYLRPVPAARFRCAPGRG